MKRFTKSALVSTFIASIVGVSFGCGGGGFTPAEGSGGEGGHGGAAAEGGAGAEGGSGQGGDGTGGASGEGGAGGAPACDLGAAPKDTSCVITDDLGIFVENDGNDQAPGTQAAPVKTLQKAIDLAAAQGKRVYACGSQTFEQALAVPAGTEIYGGLDCKKDWAWQAAKATQITALADKVPVRLLGGDETTRLVDVSIQAADASVTGGSSIAVIAVAAKVELERATVTAGDAKAGAQGAAAGAAPAAGGPDGNAGSNMSCTSSGGPLAGALPVVNPMCPDSKSGAGGASAKLNLTIPKTMSDLGQPGSAGAPAMQGGGAGGLGQKAPPVLGGGQLACTPGQDGMDGMAGDAGPGGTGPGTLGADGYQGVAGETGGVGGVGQGGGGGGGGLGCTIGSDAFGDDSGGSGGAGGCGGASGAGGLPGGASIAFVSIDSDVRLVDCVLAAGAGGSGGSGGKAQPGGSGGLGGEGASGDPVMLAPHVNNTYGCDGGQGGAGGIGGAAGGGTGGHSVAMAYIGAAPTQVGTVALTHAAAGIGGDGSGGSKDNKGADGLAQPLLEF
jgi:hypothetical protein